LLVGDIVIQSRELMNDLPRGLNLPAGITISASVVSSVGSTLPISSTYRAKATFINQFGETLATAESSALNVAADQGIQVTAPLLSQVPGATKLRIYFGSSGVASENQWVETVTLPITISAPGNPGIPPTRNTSFYPDIDGQRVNTFTLYRWLNEALESASKIAKGIPDITGFPTINTQGMYEVTGQWVKLTHGWYDGEPIILGSKSDLAYRAALLGFVGVGVLQQVANRIIIELQPQPSRSGASTLINGAFAVGAVAVTVDSVASFEMDLGLATLGTPSNYEIIAYSRINGLVLDGIVRGLGGSVEQLWPDNTPIKEANLRLSGMRVFTNPTYIPGDAAKTLAVPSGWRTPIIDFMVARFRQSEHDEREAQRRMTSFTG